MQNRKHFFEFAVPCLVYSFFSMSMVYANKYVLSVYNFHYHFTLLLIQSFAAVVLVAFFKQLGWISYPDFDWNIAKRWLPVNLLFLSMLLTGTYSLRFLSVPMMTVCKNLTNIPISFGDKYLYGQTVSMGTLISLLLMIISAVVGGATDLQFDLYGYIWMFFNCASTAAYVLYLRTAMKNTQLGEFGMMYYNNLLSLPFVTALMFIFDEAPAVFHERQLQDTGLVMMLLFSGFISFGISLSSFWCVKSTSPTTYSITGSLNKIPLAFVGMVIFDTPATPSNVFSVLLGLVGGVLYSWTKQKHLNKATKETKEASRSDDVELDIEIASRSGRDVEEGAKPLNHVTYPHSSFGAKTPVIGYSSKQSID